jgi:pSer/pThr/pTyr-binding forkhead associated (FHA) protein
MVARLILESEAGPKAYELDPARPATLGRSRENAIVLPDEHASRVHARVQCREGRWFVADLDSRNGTLLDGESIRGETPLENGHEITVGASRLRFEVDAGASVESGPVTRVIETAHGDSTTHLRGDALTTL